MAIEGPVQVPAPGNKPKQGNRPGRPTLCRGLPNPGGQGPGHLPVGEIRDRETAEVAIQAALTGHLVFSTLHTNTAAGAIMRLTNMDVEPFLIASAVVGVVAQRLVRRVCPRCEERYRPEPGILKELRL